ncbi:MAG: hypothetical protein ACR2Q4_14105, partial [Geminicoccaceae bacterium]
LSLRWFSAPLWLAPPWLAPLLLDESERREKWLRRFRCCTIPASSAVARSGKEGNPDAGCVPILGLHFGTVGDESAKHKLKYCENQNLQQAVETRMFSAACF